MSFINKQDLCQGFATFIMQSELNVERCLPLFQQAIEQGYNPNDAKEAIFNALKIFFFLVAQSMCKNDQCAQKKCQFNKTPHPCQ